MKGEGGNIKNIKMEEEVKKEFEKVWKKIQELEGKRIENVSQQETREKSLREMFLEFNLKSDPEKTLFIMHGMEKLKNIFAFSTKEIKEGFHEIREKVPKNIADKFQSLHKSGFIMPVEITDKKTKQKFWKLTNSGIKFLENKNE